MLKIQLVNAWRNLSNNRLVSSINIAGLTIGLSCAILAILFSYHELTYESCHEKADRISSVYTLGKFGPMEKIPVTFGPVGDALRSNYPEIDIVAKARTMEGVVFKDNITPISENEILFADPSIFSIFTIPFKTGHMPTEPGQIVLSEKMAGKYFSGNAVRQNISISLHGQKHDFMVAGVFKDLPTNTHLKASIIVPFAVSAQFGWRTDEYYSTDFTIYTLTKQGTDIRHLNNKIASTYKIPVDIENAVVALVPVKRMHLDENVRENTKATLYTLLVGGLLAILLSCFNYINLSSILFGTKSKEVGINKTIGAGRLEIFSQFMTHTFLTSAISFGLAFLIVLLIVPSFNNLFGVEIESIIGLKTILFILMAFVVTFLLAGFYPAFILSGYKPILLMGNIQKQGKHRLMNALITVQFVVSIILLQFVLIFTKQINHIGKYDVAGFDGSNVLCVNGNTWGDLNKVKNELLKNPKIEAVSWGSRMPGLGMGMIQEWKEEGNQEMALRFWMEGDYLKTFKIKMLEGRSFSEEFAGEDQQGVIINPLTAKSLGMDEPVGKNMMIGGKQYVIIGVTDNFQAVPPVFSDMPIIILKSGVRSDFLLVKINSSESKETQSFIGETLSKINPDFPVEMQFYQDYMAEFTKSHVATGLIFTIFTGIVLLNAMMGLFGLSYFIAQRKNKEVGIRKVHGASANDILWKLGKGFVGKFVLAFCIATPLVFMGATGFLSVFPRHIVLGPGIFLLGGLMALLILVLSAGMKLLQVSNINSVEALRYE